MKNRYLIVIIFLVAHALVASGQAITVVGHASKFNSASSVTVNLPDSVQQGDFLLAQITLRIGSGFTMIAPAGWKKIRDINAGGSSGVGMHIFYKIATAAEPASFTFSDSSGSSSSDKLGIISVYRNVDTLAPIDSEKGIALASSPYSTPDDTTVNDSCMIVTLFGIRSTGTSSWTPPAGMTEAYDTSGAQSTRITACADYLIQAVAGRTGQKTAVPSGGSGNVAAEIIALKPGGAKIITCKTSCNGWIAQICDTCAKGCNIYKGMITPTPVLQTTGAVTDTGNYGFVYWSFNAIADSTYYFDLCQSTGTNNISWLRIHNAMNGGTNYCMDTTGTPTVVLQNENNGCAGTGAGLSKLIWTCETSGTYYLESAINHQPTFWGSQGLQTAVLSYKTLPSSSAVCSDVFYDKGNDGTDGNAYNYNNNEDWIYTYYPLDTVTGAINAQFISFSASPGDVLCVYDGSSVNAPLIGCYSGPSITGNFSSTASNGALTFHFTSDDSVTSTGWLANISCVGNVGIKKEAPGHSTGIFPNPATDGTFSVYAGGGINISSVEIFNMMGEKVEISESSAVHEKGMMRFRIYSGAGIYFVRVIDGEKIYTEKLIIN